MSKDNRDLLGHVAGAIDVKHETEGEWFEHAPLMALEVGPNQIDGFQKRILTPGGHGLKRVLVASRYAEAFERDEKELARRTARMDEEERAVFAETASNALVAKHCVKDWDFTDRDGNAIPFSTELVERILSERQFRHHRNFINRAILMLQGDIERVVRSDQGN